MIDFNNLSFKKEFVFVFKVIFGVILSYFLAVFCLRWVAFKIPTDTTKIAPDNFFGAKCLLRLTPQQGHGADGALPWQLADESISRIPHLGFWLDVWADPTSAQIFLNPPNAPLPDKSTATLENRPTLGDALNRFSQSNFLINVVSDIADVDKMLADKITQLKAQDRLIITSRSEVIVRAVLQHLPNLLTATPIGEFVRLSILSSLLLEPIARLNSEMILSTDPEMITPRLVGEAHRRLKPVVVGFVTNSEAAQKLINLQVDVIITDDPLTVCR